MTSKSEWSNARRIVIILADVLLYNISIILGFMVKFGREFLHLTFVAYMKICNLHFNLFYLFEFVVRCVYFYNRKISDIIFVTVIGQILMTLTIMIVTFAGRWFTFPRSVLGYSFIIGIIVLSLLANSCFIIFT